MEISSELERHYMSITPPDLELFPSSSSPSYSPPSPSYNPYYPPSPIYSPFSPSYATQSQYHPSSSPGRYHPSTDRTPYSPPSPIYCPRSPSYDPNCSEPAPEASQDVQSTTEKRFEEEFRKMVYKTYHDSIASWIKTVREFSKSLPCSSCGKKKENGRINGKSIKKTLRRRRQRQNRRKKLVQQRLALPW